MPNVGDIDYGLVDVYDCAALGSDLCRCDYCDQLYAEVGRTVFSIESSFGTGLRVCRSCAVALAETLTKITSEVAK